MYVYYDFSVAPLILFNKYIYTYIFYGMKYAISCIKFVATVEYYINLPTELCYYYLQ